MENGESDDLRPLARARRWARVVKTDVIALSLAARDPRVPMLAKVVAGLVAAYALSPIDLIPDFIPILGYLDDLILVPLGILLAIRLIPPPLMEELRAEARERMERPVSRAAAVVIVLLWGVAAVFLIRTFWPRSVF
jgi:uncharacterized membrane protein YkvA (DUF1232 family)